MAGNDDGRPRDGTAGHQVDETTPTIPLAVHEQCEYEGEWQYARGWADGYAAGQLALADEVAAAIGVPLPDRRAVIRWLIKGMDRVPESYSSRDLFGRAA